jgi:hypothetical protein
VKQVRVIELTDAVDPNHKGQYVKVAQCFQDAIIIPENGRITLPTKPGLGFGTMTPRWRRGGKSRYESR